MNSKEGNTFDPVTHEYTIAGRPVPSVTQIIDEVLQVTYYGATDRHLDRGTAVHACAALIAQGKAFEHDPQIAGQVAACRKFFAEVKLVVESVEQQIYSVKNQYAGTYDAVVSMPSLPTPALLDWKASIIGTLPLQLAGYSIAYGETWGRQLRWGIGVELHQDGTYKCSEVYDLKRYVNKFLALRSVYSIKQDLGLLNKKGEV